MLEAYYPPQKPLRRIQNLPTTIYERTSGHVISQSYTHADAHSHRQSLWKTQEGYFLF